MYPPVRAQNTEITEKLKKIRAENVSRETFSALSCGHLSKSTHCEEAMRGRIASPSAMANAYHTPLHNQSVDNIWTGSRRFIDTLQNEV